MIAESGNKLKYLNLAHEFVEMWDVGVWVSTEIIPTFVSTNVLVPSYLNPYLRRFDLPARLILTEIQRAVLLIQARLRSFRLSVGVIHIATDEVVFS